MRLRLFSALDGRKHGLEKDCSLSRQAESPVGSL